MSAPSQVAAHDELVLAARRTPLYDQAIARGIPADHLINAILNGSRVTLHCAQALGPNGVVTPSDGRMFEIGRGYKGEIRDEFTGRWYNVFGAPCSIEGHFCDLLVELL